MPQGLNGYAAGWSPDGTKLFFWGRQGGTQDVGNLFAQDLASGESTQITNLELESAWWYELHIDVSQDGRTVIFDLPRTSSETTKWDTWSVPVTGGEPTLAVRNGAFPMYVSDGDEIAFVVPTASNFIGRDIGIANADGSRRILVQDVDLGYAPTVSPDGTRIVFPNGGSLFMVDVSTGEGSRVADQGCPQCLDDDTLIVTP